MDKRLSDTISISQTNTNSVGDSQLSVSEYVNLNSSDNEKAFKDAQSTSIIRLNVFKELDQQLQAKDFDKIKLENGRLTDLLFDRILLIEKSMVAFSLMAIVISFLAVSFLFQIVLPGIRSSSCIQPPYRGQEQRDL